MMWRKVKNWLSPSPTWRRWDAQHQQAVERYLERVPKPERTLDDWMLVVELLIHHYTSDDFALSQADYEKLKTKLRAQLAENMANPPVKRIIEAPVVDAEIAAQPLYQQLLHGYQRGAIYAIGCSCQNTCPTCQRDIHNQRYKITDLLAAYSNPVALTPVLPYTQCDYIHQDGGGFCRCSWRVIFPSPAGMSQEYRVWLQQTLKDAGLPYQD